MNILYPALKVLGLEIDWWILWCCQSITSAKFHWYQGFPESRPVFSPPMGAYLRLAFIQC